MCWIKRTERQRCWLNDKFYNTAFSEEEQAVVVNTNVVNEDNPFYNAEGGNDTADKVWLLSLGETERYFHIDRDVYYDDYLNGNMSWMEYTSYCYGQDNRVCAKPTVYASARYVYTFSEDDVQFYLEEYCYDISYAVGSGCWWLRSPGGSSGSAAEGYYGGGIHGNKDFVNGSASVVFLSGVRPALKVAY